jgi:NAD(P)-dependent dehydrogenase (short-subunit alcohol dehydrogenase family)
MDTKKIVLVTGATGTIGKATALELAKNQCRLLLIGRNRQKLESVKSEIATATGNNDIEIFIADLSEPESIRKAIGEIKTKYQSLNALLNIAAVFQKNRIETSKGMEYMFSANHLGPFILTTGLLGLLEAGKGRVVTVSAPSTTKVNFDDLQGSKKFSAGFLGVFGATKMMNLLFTYALARKVDGRGITANVFHPGLVKSDLTKDMPPVMNFLIGLMSGKPDKAAKKLCSLAIDDAYAGTNGKFIKFDGKEIKSSAYSYDPEIQEKLWSVSESLAAV